MSHINFICEIAHAYQHMPAYFHYITQNHAYLPTHTRTWVLMMAQWPPLMRGHPFWEATFTQHLGWLLVRGFTVYHFEIKLHTQMPFGVTPHPHLHSHIGIASFWSVFNQAKNIKWVHIPVIWIRNDACEILPFFSCSALPLTVVCTSDFDRPVDHILSNNKTYILLFSCA